MRGILLCGGYGKRLMPLTSIMNKHIIPVYNRHMLVYPLQTLLQIGITDICVVLGGESAEEIVHLLGDGHEQGINLCYLYQQKAGGIAEALGLCKDFVGNDSCIVILGDNIFLGPLYGFRENFESSGKDCGILLAAVDNPIEYGVPRFDGDEIVEIIEKPSVPPSKCAVTGLYAYTPAVFNEIEKLEPSKRGELEVSDLNTSFITGGKGIYWEVFRGKWADAGGSFDSLLDASLMVREELGGKA